MKKRLRAGVKWFRRTVAHDTGRPAYDTPPILDPDYLRWALPPIAPPLEFQHHLGELLSHEAATMGPRRPGLLSPYVVTPTAFGAAAVLAGAAFLTLRKNPGMVHGLQSRRWFPSVVGD